MSTSDQRPIDLAVLLQALRPFKVEAERLVGNSRQERSVVCADHCVRAFSIVQVDILAEAYAIIEDKEHTYAMQIEDLTVDPAARAFWPPQGQGLRDGIRVREVRAQVNKPQRLVYPRAPVERGVLETWLDRWMVPLFVVAAMVVIYLMFHH